LRELTQNSVEAVRTTGGGTIVWDVDWVTFDLNGVYKLIVTDDGVGMTGDEMERYINQLSSSVHQQSHGDAVREGLSVPAYAS
jgi:HSP90 family molecular chaperone